jgi:hypothetical protein
MEKIAHVGTSLYILFTHFNFNGYVPFIMILAISCPGDCNGQGSCNNKTGNCICNEGISGNSCLGYKQDNTILLKYIIK